ncbi:sensor histidine kinase [Faecalibacter macacae]|uniref:Signal transduction histidine kinase internal region domain-containing protein n=1 Tax=Faecalibacter macacae TaxID=1859289 RepID=A0A3L9MCP8_9FLAO|nr:sensor histidine kinase [Faecalibacter macacae]RLZ10768.1 hypothetical protein EAH69_06385 [Faecalibacter macacae]
MNTISKKEIIVMTIISIVFLLMPFVFAPYSDLPTNFFTSSFFKRLMLENILLVMFFIVNYFVFTTQLYLKKKYWIYAIVLLISFLIIHIIPDFVFPFERRVMPRDEGFRPRRTPWFIIWSPKVLIFACATLISVIIKQRKVYQEVKEEKQLSEIAYLRAQINPHFLFNTLNSIYALTLQKSDNAPDAVMKLSKMMRYVVTDSAADFIALQKDIDYIKNYIQLQKLRLVNQNSINISITGNFTNYSISPLLLINFIENAFKYGIVDVVENPIKIDIQLEEGILNFMVVNAISNYDVNEEDKSLTGISNSKKRLDYYYPDRYDLNIDESNQQFKVELKLDLNLND